MYIYIYIYMCVYAYVHKKHVKIGRKYWFYICDRIFDVISHGCMLIKSSKLDDEGAVIRRIHGTWGDIFSLRQWKQLKTGQKDS